jgi:hypothetical protein
MTKDEAQRRRWTFYKAVKIMRNKVKGIIPLTPCSTETLFFLGLGPKVVRISHNPPKSLPEKPIYKKVYLAA